MTRSHRSSGPVKHYSVAAANRILAEGAALARRVAIAEEKEQMATLKSLGGVAGINVHDADFVLPHGAGCRCATPATPDENGSCGPSGSRRANHHGVPPALTQVEALKRHQERLQALRGPGRPSSNDREAAQRARLLEEGIRKVKERSDRQWPD